MKRPESVRRKISESMKGNSNAAKRDGVHRVRISVSVHPDTEKYLRATGKSLGQSIDKLVEVLKTKP